MSEITYSDAKGILEQKFKAPLNGCVPAQVGVEQIGLWAMRQVEFAELLRELGLSSPIRAAILDVIIGRMAAPGSELAAYRWLGQQSGLGELLDVDFQRLPLMTLYRASDALMKYRDIIERTLFNRLHDLLGLNITVTLTNTYFEGAAAANPKAKRGRSKQKRCDCPLVTLGLVLDGSGFVRRSETFEGNVSEGQTFRRYAQRSGRAHRCTGGHGCRHRHRGQSELARRTRLPLFSGQPRTGPAIRSGNRDPDRNCRQDDGASSAG